MILETRRDCLSQCYRAHRGDPIYSEPYFLVNNVRISKDCFDYLDNLSQSEKEKIKEVEQYEVTIIGDYEYWTNKQGQLHKENGPAVSCSLYKRWYNKGKLHRDNGPAEVTFDSDGYLESEHYFVNGKLHRLAGPAVIFYIENNCGFIDYSNSEYWIDGVKYSKEQWQKIKDELAVKENTPTKADNYLVYDGKKYKLVEE